ncbi:MAG TPA: WD40 repeat domain-containing protein [Vicinamibacterales bacterium]|jgi:WD40 repeat protein|nr:WD40 repeat domain-containing protein [Vicinamibacterales bacterium]
MKTPLQVERADNPYVGPQPFTKGQRDRFFGRDAESEDLSSLIVAHREVVLYSPSGAGKSSLLAAGVIPRLEVRGLKVMKTARVVGYKPRTDERPDTIANVFAYNVLGGWTADEEHRNGTLSDYFAAAPALEGGEESRLRIVILDQLEELFTSYPERWQQREAFLGQVADALDNNRRLRVLFALREEYVGRLSSYRRLFPEQLRTSMHLDRLRPPEARKAIATPARRAGVPYADQIAGEPPAPQPPQDAPPENVAGALVTRLLPIRVRAESGRVEEVEGEFVEPVQLQIVCRKIWNRLPAEAKEITIEHVQAFGDVSEALGEYFEEQLTAVSASSGLSKGHLLRWFGRQFITDDGLRARVFTSAGRVGGLPESVARDFQKRYLLRADAQGDATWFELAHDRLLAPVREATQRRRRKVLPLQLAAAAAVLIVVGGSIFVARRANEAAVAAEQRAEGLAQRERARQALGRNAQAIAEQVMASPQAGEQLPLALATTLRAYPALQTAAQWGVLTDALRFAANSARSGANTLSTSPRGSLSLGEAVTASFSEDRTRLATWGTLPDAALLRVRKDFREGRRGVTIFDVGNGSVVARLDHSRSVQSVLLADGAKRVTLIENPGLPEVFTLAAPELKPLHPEGFSPGLLTLALAEDKDLLATGGWDGTVKLWNARSRGELRTMASAGPKLWDVAFNHSVTLMAAARNDGSVTLWEPDSGRQVRTLASHSKPARRVAFSPDDQTIATAGWDNLVKLWTVSTGALRATLAGHTRPVNSVRFSPSGQQLVTAASDGTLRLWTAAGQPVRTLRGHTRSVREAVFSPDGASIASAAADRTARLWDTATGRALATLAHPATVWSIAFDRGGQHVVTSSEDGIIRVWDLATRQIVARLGRTGLTSAPVNQSFFIGDGTRIVSVGGDDSLRWWNWRTQREEGRLWGHSTSGAFASIALDSTGSRLVLAETAGAVRIVDAVSDRTLRSFTTGQMSTSSVGFSPDGKVLATVGSTPPLKLWETESGKALAAFDGPGTYEKFTFDRTGTRVAAAGREAAPIVWSRGAAALTLTNPRAAIAGMAFSPNGDLLAGVSSSALYVWSLKTGYLIGSIAIPGAPAPKAPLVIAFSANGGTIMVAISDTLQEIGVDRVFEPDITRLLATGFEQLPATSLNRGIAQALRGQVSEAIVTLGSLSGTDRERATRLHLLDQLRGGTFSAASLGDYFSATGAVQ